MKTLYIGENIRLPADESAEARHAPADQGLRRAAAAYDAVAAKGPPAGLAKLLRTAGATMAKTILDVLDPIARSLEEETRSGLPWAGRLPRR